MKLKINAGSGQRPFGKGWINLDCQERWREASDKAGGEFMCCDMLPLPFLDGSAQYVVSHHTLEHLDPAACDSFIREAYRVLEPGGEFLVFVPNMRELAMRWLAHRIDMTEFRTHVYGAYMGDEADRHKNCWGAEELRECLLRCAPWADLGRFGNRHIEGADIAAWDWWILDMRCIK